MEGRLRLRSHGASCRNTNWPFQVDETGALEAHVAHVGMWGEKLRWPPTLAYHHPGRLPGGWTALDLHSATASAPPKLSSPPVASRARHSTYGWHGARHSGARRYRVEHLSPDTSPVRDVLRDQRPSRLFLRQSHLTLGTPRRSVDGAVASALVGSDADRAWLGAAPTG